MKNIEKEVPFKVDYEKVKIVDIIITILLWSSAIVVITIIFVESINFINRIIIKNFLTSLLAFISVIYFLLNILHTYLFYLAEFNRKDDFIDNSLNTNLCEKHSKGYFSNDNTVIGITKLGINCFENSFFTKNITKKMFEDEFKKSIFIVCLFVFVIIFQDEKFFKILLQISLPFVIIHKTIKLYILNRKTAKVFSNFKNIFTITNEGYKNQLIIDNVLSYEKTLSWASTLLSSKIFNNLNPTLELEWEKIKRELSLN